LINNTNIKEKLDAFVVTENSNQIYIIDGIPVVALNDIKKFDLKKYTVIVAVSEKYIPEISNKLKDYTFKEIVILADYVLEDSKLRDIHDKQLLNLILDWHICHNMKFIGDYEKISSLEKQKIRNREKATVDNKTIVFIIGYVNVRVVKIMGALSRKGYKVVALKYEKNDLRDARIKNELLQNNLTIIECSEIEELFYIALQYKPLLYYFEPEWSDCNYAELMIKHKKLFGKIVISIYDVMNSFYANISVDKLSAERFSLENADGIVWRYFAKEYLEKKGFIFRGKSTQFLDCCTGYERYSKEITDNNLNLCVVAGNIDNLLVDQKEGVEEVASLKTILGKLGNLDNCKIHLFINYGSKEDKELCDLYEKKFHNFKVYWGSTHDELIQRISNYDFGCLFYTDGKIVGDDEIIFDRYYGSENKYSVSNRYFDYIDAEIPIITSSPTKLCEIFDEYSIRVNMNINNLDVDYLIKNKEKYKNHVKKAKEDFSIDNQINGLIDFFNQL
jgi:hypothetical protein